MEINDKKSIFYFLLLVPLIIISIKCCSTIGSNKLEDNYRYTVAEITKTGITAEGAFFADIVYRVQNKEYSDFVFLKMEESAKYQVGDKYFIKYYPVDPYNSEVELNLVVPKSIKSVPPDGWKELPIN